MVYFIFIHVLKDTSVRNSEDPDRFALFANVPQKGRYAQSVKSVDFRQVVRLSWQLIYSHYFYDLSTFEGMRKANFIHLLIHMVIRNRYIGL